MQRTTLARRAPGGSTATIPFPAARHTTKAPRPSIEDGLKPQAVLAARAIGRMQRTTRARRAPGGSTATILFPGCAAHGKASRPSIENGLKPQAALPARAIGRMQRTASHTTRARRVPGDSTAAIPFPAARRTEKAPRSSIGDGLKPQTAFAAADSARTGNWTDVPET